MKITIFLTLVLVATVTSAKLKQYAMPTHNAIPPISNTGAHLLPPVIPVIEPTHGLNLTNNHTLKENNTMLFAPPFTPEGFYDRQFRMIPPEFWFDRQGNFGRDFIILKNAENYTLLCDQDGEIDLHQTNNNTNPNTFWIPEFLEENILRLRSYNGGYLSYDLENNQFSCDTRTKNLFNRWNILLSNDKESRCLYLFYFDGKFIEFNNDNLSLDFWNPANRDQFCFRGMRDFLSDFNDEELYFFSLNSRNLTASNFHTNENTSGN